MNPSNSYNSVWGPRITLADNYFESWHTLFKCNQLWDYFEGRQWKNVPQGYNPYTFNEVYATLAIKISSYLFGQPRFQVTPTPSGEDYNIEFASQSAQLKEDTLNTIVGDPKCHFKQEVELAFQDSWFRFGIIEVGYDADWIRNPQAGKPLKKSDKDGNIDFRKDRIIQQPEELPVNERIYIKRIHPRTFRVGGTNVSYLDRCSWVGYFDFVDRGDLLTHKKLKYRDKVENAGAVSFSNLTDFTENNAGNYGPDSSFNSDLVKVWHIWDLRQMKRLLLLDGGYEELWSAPFKRLPLFDIRWIYRDFGFYPVPPVFHWLSPQDEINEAREQMRAHRRRFTRKYMRIEGTVDDEEADKFTNGDDGTIFTVKRDNAIQPVADSPIGMENATSLTISKDEFNILTGTSSEMRGQADRTTATQAKLIDVRSSVREDYEATKVKDWLVSASREILLLMRDKYALGMWVKLNRDPGNFLGEVQDMMPIYKWVTTEDLRDGYDFNIALDISSVSPASQQQALQSFVQFISLVNQFPQISLSPTLIVETAYRCGYRDMKVIRQMQKMAMLQTLGMIHGAQQNSIAQAQTAQATPNTQTQVQNQLQNQVGGLNG